jgi:hypothetical protein
MLQKKNASLKILTLSIVMIATVLYCFAASAANDQALPQVPFRSHCHFGVPLREIEAAETKVQGNYSCSDPDIKEHTEVSFGLADDGNIYDPQITQFTGSDQHDVECLEAICGASPVGVKADSQSLSLRHVALQFANKQSFHSYMLPSFDGSDVRQYLHDHPQPVDEREAFVVVHKIPLFILSKYPELFTKDELINPTNLMEMKVGYSPSINPVKADGRRDAQPDYVRRLCSVYGYWTKNVDNSTKMTKEVILEHAKRAITLPW